MFGRTNIRRLTARPNRLTNALTEPWPYILSLDRAKSHWQEEATRLTFDWVTHTPSTAFRHLQDVVNQCLESNAKHWLVYDILPLTTAVFSYAIGFRKLSANEQFFVGAQTVVSVLDKQLKLKRSRVIHIATNKVYKSNPKSFESRRNSFFHPGWMRLVFTWVLGR